MQKFFIQNRKGQKIAVIVEQSEAQAKGLAFVMHGLGGFKEQPHIRAMAEAFLENGYAVVTFDTTNTIGESDGKYEDATVTSSYADLEDLINWSKNQEWYIEPFILVGHSLGGFCTAYYAENNPNLVKAVTPVSALISGKLSIQTEKHNGYLDEWEKFGWRVTKSESKPGMIKKLPWSHILDRLKYDLLPNATKLTMPVLMIVGSEDNRCPVTHQKMLLDAVPGKKELQVIENAPHTFRTPEHLAELKQIFDQWIKKLDKSI